MNQVEIVDSELVYIGLGGNIGDPAALFERVLDRLALQPGIYRLRCSPFYSTSPVSDIPQADYTNAVAAFHTTLPIERLRDFLFSIEKELGKVPKERNAPRAIDIDLLFYGTKRITLPHLQVPHPRWRERLFVLRPLADLTDSLCIEREEGGFEIIDIRELLKNFINRHREVVKQLEKEWTSSKILLEMSL